MINSIARIVAGTATIAALSIGLAGSASADTGDQSCANTGVVLLGCTQVTDVLTDLDLDLDVLSDLAEIGDVLTLTDVIAQVPVAGNAVAPR